MTAVRVLYADIVKSKPVTLPAKPSQKNTMFTLDDTERKVLQDTYELMQYPNYDDPTPSISPPTHAQLLQIRRAFYKIKASRVGKFIEYCKNEVTIWSMVLQQCTEYKAEHTTMLMIGHLMLIIEIFEEM